MTQKRLHITDILTNGWKKLAFDPFRPGIEICLLHDGSRQAPLSISASGQEPSDIDSGEQHESDQPTVALLRYAAGASVPRHRHIGIETILVLDGSQSDEEGIYETGSVVINPVGSEHSVWSENGCVVLIQWDKPVEFIE